MSVIRLAFDYIRGVLDLTLGDRVVRRKLSLDRPG
jgi:hypothetical protein